MRPGQKGYPGWLHLYETTLNGFSTEVLAHAAQKVVKNWRKRQFPLPAELLDFCIEAEREIVPRRQTVRLEDKRDEPDMSWNTPEHREFMAECLAVTREWFAAGKLAASYGYTADHARDEARRRLEARAVPF